MAGWSLVTKVSRAPKKIGRWALGSAPWIGQPPDSLAPRPTSASMPQEPRFRASGPPNRRRRECCAVRRRSGRRSSFKAVARTATPVSLSISIDSLPEQRLITVRLCSLGTRAALTRSSIKTSALEVQPRQMLAPATTAATPLHIDPSQTHLH